MKSLQTQKVCFLWPPVKSWAVSSVLPPLQILQMLSASNISARLAAQGPSVRLETRPGHRRPRKWHLGWTGGSSTQWSLDTAPLRLAAPSEDEGHPSGP